MEKPLNPNPYYALDDLVPIGSQDPADQPTAEDYAEISLFFQEQKKLRAAEAAANLAEPDSVETAL